MRKPSNPKMTKRPAKAQSKSYLEGAKRPARSAPRSGGRRR